MISGKFLDPPSRFKNLKHLNLSGTKMYDKDEKCEDEKQIETETETETETESETPKLE